jgi:hypothetical protein
VLDELGKGIDADRTREERKRELEERYEELREQERSLRKRLLDPGDVDALLGELRRVSTEKLDVIDQQRRVTHEVFRAAREARFHGLLEQARPHLHHGEQVTAAALGSFGERPGFGAQRWAGILIATPNRIVCYASSAWGHVHLESLPYIEFDVPALVPNDGYYLITFRRLSAHKFWQLNLPFGGTWGQVADPDAVESFIELLRAKVDDWIV